MKEKCDSCGESLYDPDKMSTVVGIYISCGDGESKEGKRVKEIFGETEFSICFVCVLRAFGVKESE